MVKKRSFYNLAAICCQFATAISLVDCKQSQQCVWDYRSDAFSCYLNPFNVSTNDLVVRSIIDASQLWLSRSIVIVSAYTDDDDVEVYCNTRSITLEMHKDHQSPGDIDIHIAYCYKYMHNKVIYHTLIHAKIYDIRLIGQVIQTGENKQIILNCSVTGVYNTNDITEFQFNDDDSSLCRKTRQLSESEGRTDKPYTQLLNDGTTCQLIIPKATKADFVGYQCQVKLQFPTGRYCYILSETIIPYEEVQTTTLSGEELTPGEVFITTTDMLLNDSSSIIITIKAEIIDAIVIIVAIVAVVAIVLIVAVVVVKAMKYFCKYRQHVPRLPDRLLDNEERREDEHNDIENARGPGGGQDVNINQEDPHAPQEGPMGQNQG